MVAHVLAIQMMIAAPSFPSEPTLWDMRTAEGRYLLNAKGCDEKDVRASYQIHVLYEYEDYCTPTEGSEEE